MAFLYSSQEELGYDPKVTRYLDDHSYTYEIPNAPANTGSRFFRATSDLSFYRSNNITGRVSRVWLVKEVAGPHAAIKPGERDLALKDVWLDHKAKTEKQIQNAIFQDIEDFWRLKPDQVEESLKPLLADHQEIVQSREYKKYFLKINTDYIGITSKPPAIGSRRLNNVLLRFTPPASAPKLQHQLTKSGRPPISRVPTGSSPRTTPAPSRRKPVERQFVPRRQYRVVFEEVCDTVGSLKTTGEVVSALSSVLTGKLRLLS